MKKTGLVAASMAAASATAVSSGVSTSIKTNIPQEDDVSGEKKKKNEKSAPKPSNSSDKFAPRFDGLRFIETLVTAHR